MHPSEIMMRTFKLTKRELAELVVRDCAIAALGWEPEDRSSAGNRYSARTSEMIHWAAETNPALAEELRAASCAADEVES